MQEIAGYEIRFDKPDTGKPEQDQENGMWIVVQVEPLKDFRFKTEEDAQRICDIRNYKLGWREPWVKSEVTSKDLLRFR